MNNLNEFMAEKVMEWYHDKDRWIDTNDKEAPIVMGYHAWNPTQNIDQAFMCADKAGIIMRINCIPHHGWTIEIGNETRIRCKTLADLPKAICECIYKTANG